jgi:RimJ/RimL family protein N-acetyltransferase
MVREGTLMLELYPREIRSRGTGVVSLRLMNRSDRDRILDFVRSLPPDDLLFLRKDITDPKVVDEWVRDVEAWRTITVLAEVDGELQGCGSVWRDESFWGRDLGEIRVLVRPDYRNRGLGRRITFEMFVIAKDLGLDKTIARITPEQERTRASLERVGFTAEAVLRGLVRDRDGKDRDLLVMSSNLGRLTDVEHLTAWKRS